jgi:hypothetical protein
VTPLKGSGQFVSLGSSRPAMNERTPTRLSSVCS